MSVAESNSNLENPLVRAWSLDSVGLCHQAWELLSNKGSGSDLFWSLSYRLDKFDCMRQQKADGDYQKSLRLWIEGEKSQAVSMITRLAARRKTDVIPALQLAMFLRSQNMISAAKDRLEKLHVEFKDYKPIEFYLAETCLITGDIERAIELFEQCPEEVVRPADYYWRLAKAYQAASKDSISWNYYKTAESHGIANNAFWMEYAKIASSCGGSDSDVKAVLERGDLACGKTLAYARSAGELCKELDADELWEAYLLLQLQRGSEECKVLPDLIYACSKLFGKGRRPEKIEQAKQLASRLPLDESSDPEVYYSMANVLFFYNRILDGLRVMEEGHGKDPEAWRRQGGYLFHSLYDQSLSPEQLFARNKAAGSAIEARFEPMQPVSLADLNGRPLRVGWVSPDLRTHPVGYFLDAVVDHLPKDRIHSFFYDNFDARDILADRFRARDGWRNIKGMPDQDVAEMIRRDEIDILVDISGHTTGNRLTVFACKPAPVQVSWLGYPGTTGLERIDYRISDHDVEPPGRLDELSTERIWRMPNGFHAFCPPFDYPDVTPLPALKEGIITFGCYNNLHKINETVLSVWSGILQAVPNSRLLLKHENLAIPENRAWVAKAFKINGIDIRRIHFKGRMDSVQRHIAAYSWVDIALDPFPYNGTTTNCDALYMGVPVIGLEGDRHVSRVTASFMRRLGMDDWVATSEGDYVRIAKEKASDLRSLAELRAGLRQRFIDCPLGNPEAFAQDLAEAFHGMWTDARKNHDPSDIVNRSIAGEKF